VGDRHSLITNSAFVHTNQRDPYASATHDLVTRVKSLAVDSIADIGCGDAGITDVLARSLGPQVTVYAVDQDPDVFVHNWRNRADASVIEVVRDVNDLRLPRLVDVIVSRFLLIDLATPLEAIRQMRSWLRPGGHLVLLEPITSTGRVNHQSLMVDSDEIVNPDIGIELAELLEATHFSGIELFATTPVGIGESLVGRYLGAMTGNDPDPRDFVALPTLVTAWGRRPLDG
jgi:SAM-dependent methyltransferase